MNKKQQIIFIGVAMLFFSSNALAADAPTELSSWAQRFFDWFSSLGGRSSTGSGSAGQIVRVFERMLVIGNGILSTMALIWGIWQTIQGVIGYLKLSKGETKPAIVHTQIITGILLCSSLPILYAIGNSFGFGAPTMFSELSKLAQSCAGIMGQTCSASDSASLRDAFFLTIFRAFNLIGFGAFLWGFLSLPNVNKGNGLTLFSCFTLITVGIFLFYMLDVLLAVGNSFDSSSPLVDGLRHLKLNGG